MGAPISSRILSRPHKKLSQIVRRITRVSQAA